MTPPPGLRWPASSGRTHVCPRTARCASGRRWSTEGEAELPHPPAYSATQPVTHRPVPSHHGTPRQPRTHLPGLPRRHAEGRPRRRAPRRSLRWDRGTRRCSEEHRARLDRCLGGCWPFVGLTTPGAPVGPDGLGAGDAIASPHSALRTLFSQRGTRWRREGCFRWAARNPEASQVGAPRPSTISRTSAARRPRARLAGPSWRGS